MCHLQNSKAVVAMEAYFVEGAANSKHVHLFFLLIHILVLAILVEVDLK
jgi:hypothetical protein